MPNSKIYLAILISMTAFIPMQKTAAATQNWDQPTESSVIKAPPSAIVTANQPFIEREAHWAQVAGCARDIAAGENGVVYVTGCDVIPNSRGSSNFYRWSGAAFVPLSVPGHGSAIATFIGNSYTIGGDAMLYSSINDGEWIKRGTPDYQPITDIGAGRAGVWIITSQANGEAGNAIHRSQRCPSSALTGGKDFCGWIPMEGAAVRISVGAGAWVVNAQGHIYEWRDGSNQWQKRPGCFTDVAANGNHVYAVSCKRGNGDGNAIYRWNNAGSWVDVQGAGKRVAVDAAGNAWAITDSGEIWRRSDNRSP